jgi:ATP-dependent DNA helicase RecG
VLFQALKDMEKSHGMQRLLEWDVWTGKTVVAQVAAIHAIKESDKLNKKIQVVIMAPTEILARQHFEWMQELFWDFGISSHLLVWSVTKKNKDAIKADMKTWNIDVIIWTHALVQEDVLFHNLWFVIIDEQHRFWVKQREVLETGLWNATGLIPHSLNMTATPIPRTLALTLYWDQDLSIISQYPKGRKDIFTKVARDWAQRDQVELFIASELEKWRQVFWISPLVEESEKMDLANAISTYETLCEIYGKYNVGLLHWKMKAREKDQVMKDFNDNKIQVLSSTSVVEVWVNVPNATIMCIEWAERFGLSQLHQFRGRVGRWKYQSHCYLFPSKWNSTDRLKAMERTNNGFELAEVDLELRWPGEVYWLRQSGVPDLKIADLRDLELISQIRVDIEEIFEDKKEELQG